MRAPVRLADLQTRAEALSFLRATFERQLEAARGSHWVPSGLSLLAVVIREGIRLAASGARPHGRWPHGRWQVAGGQ